jgi:hypothetical protein
VVSGVLVSEEWRMGIARGSAGAFCAGAAACESAHWAWRAFIVPFHGLFATKHEGPVSGLAWRAFSDAESPGRLTAWKPPTIGISPFWPAPIATLARGAPNTHTTPARLARLARPALLTPNHAPPGKGFRAYRLP